MLIGGGAWGEKLSKGLWWLCGALLLSKCVCARAPAFDWPGKDPLQYSATVGNWTRAMERTDSEINSFSYWAIMTWAMKRTVRYIYSPIELSWLTRGCYGAVYPLCRNMKLAVFPMPDLHSPYGFSGYHRVNFHSQVYSLNDPDNNRCKNADLKLAFQWRQDYHIHIYAY